MNAPAGQTVCEEGLAAEKGVIVKPSLLLSSQYNMESFRRVEIYRDTIIRETELVRNSEEALRAADVGDYFTWLCEASLDGRHASLRSKNRLDGNVFSLEQVMVKAQKARHASRRPGGLGNGCEQSPTGVQVDDPNSSLPESLQRSLTAPKSKAKSKKTVGSALKGVKKSVAAAKPKGITATSTAKSSDPGILDHRYRMVQLLVVTLGRLI